MPPRYFEGIMYINELHIEKYKVLEDIHINFQVPKDNQNALNILAGPNGCGKTSLLELLFNGFKIDNYLFSLVDKFYFRFLDEKEIKKDSTRKYSVMIPVYIRSGMNAIDIEWFYKDLLKNETQRIIYVPAKIAFNYSPIYQINTKYLFFNEVHPDSILGNAEFYIKEYIITKERQSTKSDPKERAKDAVDSFNAIFQDTDFVTRLTDLDPFQNNRPIFETINHERITIEQLSDGEKQLYGRVISLLMLNPHNSLILIDEPEIGLHPKWQYTIMDIYKNIGQNNQFIIATHSPHILAKAHYKQLILLKKKDNKIVAEQFDKPPTSRDINSVLGGIMEAKYLPDDITEWHRQYRDLVEKGEKDSPEAQALRSKILEYEPEESEFMQSIRFYEALNS